MLLTITTTQRPATDLSRLLLADPDDVRTCRFPFGEALVFFPQHDSARCTAAVLVQPAEQQVRTPLATLAVVLATVFESAIHQVRAVSVESHAQPRRFEVQAPAPGTDVEVHAHRLFDPLGYELDFGADGSLWLSGTVDVASLLSHLCVLLPVLEGARAPGEHDAIDRLLAEAGGWLAAHPEYGLIAGREPEPAPGIDPGTPRPQVHRLRMCSRHVLR